MKRVYVDSSTLVGVLFNEEEASVHYKHVKTYDEATSSYLLEAEIYSACARESIEFAKADELIECLSLVIPDRSLKKEYCRIFDRGYCRGADAYHLATALYLDPSCQELTFLTTDGSQSDVARKIGFKTA